jgi:hypothetical protein
MALVGIRNLVRFDKRDIEFLKEFLGAVDDSHRALVSKVLYGIFTRYVIPSIKVATSLIAS